MKRLTCHKMWCNKQACQHISLRLLLAAAQRTWGGRRLGDGRGNQRDGSNRLAPAKRGGRGKDLWRACQIRGLQSAHKAHMRQAAATHAGTLMAWRPQPMHQHSASAGPGKALLRSRGCVVDVKGGCSVGIVIDESAWTVPGRPGHGHGCARLAWTTIQARAAAASTRASYASQHLRQPACCRNSYPSYSSPSALQMVLMLACRAGRAAGTDHGGHQGAALTTVPGYPWCWPLQVAANPSHPPSPLPSSPYGLSKHSAYQRPALVHFAIRGAGIIAGSLSWINRGSTGM